MFFFFLIITKYDTNPKLSNIKKREPMCLGFIIFILVMDVIIKLYSYISPWKGKLAK